MSEQLYKRPLIQRVPTLIHGMQKKIEEYLPAMKELCALAISFPFLASVKGTSKPRQEDLKTRFDQISQRISSHYGKGFPVSALLSSRLIIDELREDKPTLITRAQARSEIERRYGSIDAVKKMRSISKITTALLRIAEGDIPVKYFVGKQTNFNEILAQLYEIEINSADAELLFGID